MSQTCLKLTFISYYQVITDDKGTVAIVVFGLQAAAKMQSHAVCAAVQMFDQVKEQCNASLAIGVTTGNVFCGAIGSSTRCEYAVVGDKVNMAARLMASTFKAISKDGAIYFSELVLLSKLWHSTLCTDVRYWCSHFGGRAHYRDNS
jgi:uncharacterized low-complexity protein